MSTPAEVEIFLTKVILKPADIGAGGDAEPFVYVQSKWFNDHVDIFLQETVYNKCYKGELAYEKLKESALELDIEFDMFYAECRNALISNIAVPDFEYELDRIDMLFKLYKKQAFCIQYMELSLEEAKNNYEMLETAMQYLEIQRKNNLKDTEVAERSEQTHNETMEAYNCCVEEKKVTEIKMLKKFLTLLNSKKEKIVQLQKHLIVCNTAGPDGTRPGTSFTFNKDDLPESTQKKRNALQSDDEDDDFDYMANTEILTHQQDAMDVEPDKKEQ